MKSSEIRKAFLDFFEQKAHKIVPSAPMVIKDDPTLMFTNAGMNQFKDLFLDNEPVKYARIADAQKCLRVSGKHNDLEEVGHDTYHHTMFEMLGNWSFGDYFKKEAIDWAWEFLADVLKIDPNRLYATVFEGDKADNLEPDNEAKEFWKKHLPQERILYGNKKDNFWEMGETGPCGPCSEIHVDLRNDNERKKISGSELVNKDNPLVIEIWNLVFIQFDRKNNGKLVNLPNKHIDTGMGFERLCMVIQGKKSNYDIDIFQSIIQKIEQISDKKYGTEQQTDIAFRVIADHLRTISFSIADGQLPSNVKAGYVIRRILRRAVRYGFTYLQLNEPFIYKLVPVLIEVMGENYPELKQQQLIEKVILEEEKSFLHTLETGIKHLDQLIDAAQKANQTSISGKDAFTLYDTYGFPIDLTELILKEKKISLNIEDFNAEMQKQKDRARKATKTETDEWIELKQDDVEEFIGYDYTETPVEITRYRKIKTKKKEFYQLVFNITPFYAEAGGQVGDTGYIESTTERIEIIDTKKENNLIVHIAKKIPQKLNVKFTAVVNNNKRTNTQCNHSATHLLHHALRSVLGTHVEQKGSLVDDKRLRFDFSHFQKLAPEELQKIETMVNRKIRQNIELTEKRAVPMAEAQSMGAMMLFGEKYGDLVRVIKFDDSVELCGGTHVKSTGEIGLFKIVSETAIAAGIRRIEAITSDVAENYINNELNTLKAVRLLLKNPVSLEQAIEKILDQNNELNKKVEEAEKEHLKQIKRELINKNRVINGVNVIAEIINVGNVGALKDISFQLKEKIGGGNLYLILGTEVNGKANLSIMISDDLIKALNLNAGKIISEAAKEIKGGGGGQPFFATAGGKNPAGLKSAIEKAIELLNVAMK